MGNDVQLGDWVVLSENREAVLAALERGESDGILPAASSEASEGLDFRRMAAFPGIELVAYWKDYYAIIFASEFMQIIAQWPLGIQRSAQARQKAFEQALLKAS